MDLKTELFNIYRSEDFPEYDDFMHLLEKALNLLENENSLYRPKEKYGEKFSGGLLDFCSEKKFGKEKKPVVVIPDIHAREYFLWHILNFEIELEDLNKTSASEKKSGQENEDCLISEKMSILEACQKKLIYLVCVGDIFHSELRCYDRWKEAFAEFNRGVIKSEAMNQEMLENLKVLQMILKLKLSCPENFHCLKGNHENILNEEGRGNHPFYKMAAEGEMFYQFMSEQYDDAVLYILSCLEHALPLCAVFPNLVISHAEPFFELTRSKIINYRKFPEVTLALTWTANGEAKKDSVSESIKNLLGKNCENAVWIGGHRPVKNKYGLRQNGKYVQIHNPDEENIAVVKPDRKFNPETDILRVDVEI